MEHSLAYHAALKRAGVPVEMHLYAEGSHKAGEGGAMKQRSAVTLAVIVSLFACLASERAQAQAKSPTEAYLAFVAAAQKAKSLEDVLPHLSKQYSAMLSAQPNDRKPVWLERLKDSADMTEIKIGKETINGMKCTLEGTAKSSKGNPLKGKVFLVKEDGAWKLDEQGWST